MRRNTLSLVPRNLLMLCSLLSVLISVGCETRTIAPATPSNAADLEAFSKEIGVTDIPMPGAEEEGQAAAPASGDASQTDATPTTESVSDDAPAEEGE